MQCSIEYDKHNGKIWQKFLTWFARLIPRILCHNRNRWRTELSNTSLVFSSNTELVLISLNQVRYSCEQFGKLKNMEENLKTREKNNSYMRSEK